MDNTTALSRLNATAVMDAMFFSNTTTTTGPSEEDTSLYNDVEKYFWIIFSPLFLLIGITGNILNVVVLFRLKFHKNSTYILLFILAFTDMAVLIVGLFRYWIVYLVDKDMRLDSEFSCKFSLFLIYFTMQLSSWILVLVTIIRFMKTFIPLRKSTYKNITVKHTLIAVVVTAFLLFGVNMHFFWTNGIVVKDGEKKCTSLNPDYFFFDEHVFVFVDLVFLSVLPAIIMIVFNALICLELGKLTKTRRRMSLQSGPLNNNKQNKHKSTRRVTWMLVVTTSYFIVATIPICIYFIVDTYVRGSAGPLTKSRLDLAWTFTYLFQFSHFALNFYLYTATNEKFRNELTKFTVTVYKRISTSSQTVRAPSRDYSSDSAAKKCSATAST